jgi:hypothetical protein
LITLCYLQKPFKWLTLDALLLILLLLFKLIKIIILQHEMCSVAQQF